MNAPRDPVSAADDLTTALGKFERRLAAAVSYGKRSRKIIWWTVVSLVIDVALTGAVWYFAAQAHNTQVTVTELHSAQVSACQATNQTREQEIALWRHIYTLGVTKKTPPKARAEDNALIRYVEKVFAARDCRVLYRIGN